VKFEDEHIGGKELGPVRIRFEGDNIECNKLIGHAKSLLGELKRRTYLADIKCGEEHVILSDKRYISTLYDLLLSGEVEHEDIPIDRAKRIDIEVIVKSKVDMHTILGRDGHADNDEIVITAKKFYRKVGELVPPTLIAFTAHYKKLWPATAQTGHSYVDVSVVPPVIVNNLEGVPSAHLEQSFLIASEPYGTSGNGLSYFSIEAKGDLTGTSQMNLEYQAGSKGGGFEHYDSSNLWNFSYVMPGTIGVIENGDSTTTGEHWPFIKALKTPYGLYMTEKAAFNHVDERYEYQDGFVAKAAMFPYKDIHEDTVIWEDFVEQISNFGPYAIVGNLDVEKNGKFLDGWYGFGVATRHFEEAPLYGGIVFIVEFSNGMSIKHEMDFEIEIGSEYHAAGTYFLLNPTTGILNQYDVPLAESPFNTDTYGGTPTIITHVSPVLLKDFDPELKPTKSFNLYDDVVAAMKDQSRTR
jgi:hypothetical protein